MKFVHLTDTHLGKSEAKLLERELDFYSAFKQAIDYAIENRTEFVIHSGDLFDTARPSTRTLIFTVDQLMRLKEAKIPFYIATGSHDIGTEDTIITVLEKMKLLINLTASRYYSIENDKISLNGEYFNDVFICGMSGKRNNIQKSYELLNPKNNGAQSIFIFHHAISDINEKFADIPTSLLPKGFDYYAGGHWHAYFETAYDKGIVVYPGSTEYNDLNEMENSQGKYFCDIEINGAQKSIKKIQIKTRPIETIEMNCTEKNAEEIAPIIVGKMKFNPEEKPILIIKIKGALKKGIKSDINRGEIIESARKNNYLYAKIYFGEIRENTAGLGTSSKKEVGEIEKEYLKRQEYSENEIKIAQKMIALLGSKMMPEEIKKRQNAAIETIRGFLLDN